MISMLFLFFLYRGPDQWALVPVAIGQDIHSAPPSTSLAASVASGRLTRVSLRGDTPLQPLRAHYHSIAQCDAIRIASPSFLLQTCESHL
jgi:hypothetical protein